MGRERLLQVIASVRRRWRLKLALRGLAVVLGGMLAVVLLASWGMDQFRFGPAAVTVFRVVSWLALAALVWRFLVRPLSRRVSDLQVALYLEEHEPTLGGTVITAVEPELPDSELSPALLDRVVESAIARCAAVDAGRRVERPALYRSSGLMAGVTLAGAAIVLLSPAFLRHGAPLLLAPWRSSAAAEIYSIEVEPGNARLARGGDQRIGATLHGFQAEQVELAVKTGENGKWDRLPMTLDEETGTFVVLLLDVDDQAEYFVEASGVRSPLFRLTVADLPYSKQIDLEYHYPTYTGLPVETVEDGGDIAALRGTAVVVTVTPTIPTRGGALRIEGSPEVVLTAQPDGRLSGTLKVEKTGFYRIRLQGPDGEMVDGSPDYGIDVLTDQPPSVTVVRPGRDTRVTPVEEVFSEIEAHDDFGIRRLELVYSVNGAPESTLVLGGSTRRSLKESRGTHTFFLEELSLQPGDFVSYFARASDGRPGSAQVTTTDIYFLQIVPFGREYKASENRGGGGGGMGMGGGFEPGALSQRQREIIAATFKLLRDREQYTDREYREHLTTVELSQEALRTQVQQLLERMQNRGVMNMDSAFQRIGQSLPQAIKEMESAEQELEQRAPKDALPPEQRALVHLQRAEAVFREVQVAMGGGGGGGGGGAFPNAEDLADLFELELDKLQNQYETVQRGERMETDNQIDETLQRLRELARRQEQENERQRRLGSQRAAGASGNQRQLADQTEELARQLERLAREQSQPELERSARQLRDAAEAMRRGAAGSQGTRAGEGVAALDRLEEARRLLDRTRRDRVGQEAQEAIRQAEQIAEQQRRIEEEVQQLKPIGQNAPDRMMRLLQRKDQLNQAVQNLESHLDRMTREAGRERRDAHRALDSAANSIRDNKLKEKIRFSKGVVAGRSPEYAREFEGEISRNIQELRDRIASAARAMEGESSDEKMGQSLRQARDLVRGMESLDERLRERTNRPSRDGEQGEQGQQGQRGQQGQQGQQGQGEQGGRDSQGGEAGGGLGDRFGGPDGPGGRGVGLGRRLSEDEIRQYQRELRERRGDAERLRQQLQRDGQDTGDIRRLIEGMRALEDPRLFNDPAEFERLRNSVVDGIKQFEYALRRELEDADQDRLFLSGSDEVPSGYREMVEEYYRSLSRAGEGARSGTR